MKTSACGLICEDCQFFQNECEGCFQETGRPFWTNEPDAPDICPLFECSINQKGFNHCGDYEKLPCKLFVDLKDPNISDIEHQKSIQERIKNLHGRHD